MSEGMIGRICYPLDKLFQNGDFLNVLIDPSVITLEYPILDPPQVEASDPPATLQLFTAFLPFRPVIFSICFAVRRLE